MAAKKTFTYFAYGSNLLSKRIHIQNPSAVRKCIGELKDYRLDFIGYAKRWGGAPATIVPHVGESVWGTIWEINMENSADLDNQEGVNENVYFRKMVDINLVDGRVIPCRVYQLTVDPPNDCNYLLDKPSFIYLNTVIEGAKESKLPLHYLKKLQAIPHNGNDSNTEMGNLLKRL